MAWQHIPDDDFERYYLGMIPEAPELDLLEEHILACAICAERAAASDEYVDAIRAGAIEGNFDLDY